MVTAEEEVGVEEPVGEVEERLGDCNVEEERVEEPFGVPNRKLVHGREEVARAGADHGL